MMKRILAITALVAALGVLTKLAFKRVEPSDAAGRVSADRALNVNSAGADPKSALLEKYQSEPTQVRDLVARVAERFGRNAQAIERTDGLRGLVLLDRLDLEAVFLHEKHPAEFRRLRDLVGDSAAADLLLHWREYFGLKRADSADREILIAEIARLSPIQKRIAAAHPSVLPLILADPPGIAELIQRMCGNEPALGDALAVLNFISLENGSSDLRLALRTFDQHGPIALEAVRLHGLEGFALVRLYGPILEALGDALPLDQSLILLRVNADYVDELLQTHRPETVASHLRHIAAAGLVEAVGGSPHALRLVVEQGEPGERALKKAGPDAADVVFGDFADATLRRQAVDALAIHGPMALAMLDKYATDTAFRAILRTKGAAIIPPIAQADAGPETVAYLQSKTRRSFTESLALAALFASGDNGQATIRTIKKDGLDRVARLNDSQVRFYQFLPLYDVTHLGNVVRQGYSPTSAEMTWALVDACFVVADVLSLAAVSPEGAVAAEAVRSEVKASVREGIKSAGRGLAANGGESTGKALARQQAIKTVEQAAGEGSAALSRRLARWWTVRSAGGMYQVLRRLPEALPQLSLTQVSQMAGPLCAKAGLRVSTWGPVRLLKEGAEVVLRIPPSKGLKYLGAQAVQAGVGVVGFRKMEEHLASRRPQIRR
ncbi:MAG: hypothetical protein ACLQIB_28135 [Isosphaeraceae bacterium]